MNKKICVIGGGRWGQNHIRTLYQMGNLSGIVESNEKRLVELLENYPANGYQHLDEAINEEYDGFIVATPAETHYEIGKKLLEKGCNVLIEKPMTLHSDKAKKLVQLAKKNKASLMVGHILLFHPAINRIKEVIEEGVIGDILYIYSTRVNFGTVRTKENVWWSFAPHDISVINYLIGEICLEIESHKSELLQEGIADTVITHMKYPNNIMAHIFVSWLHPFKEQRLVVIGSKGMITFEDSSVNKKICLYKKKIDFIDEQAIKIQEPDSYIDYIQSSPLENELRYFINNLDGKIEVADGQSGYEVVKILELKNFI